MPGCAAQPGGGIVSAISGYVDCQNEGFVRAAYQTLASPGSTFAILLTTFLTIVIALFGYNLLLGNAPSLRSGTLTMAKIGMVLALATSWPAYQTLVYDLAVNGPDEIAAEIGRGAGVPGSDGTLRLRLDAADTAMVQLAIVGPGPYAADTQTATGSNVPPPPSVGFNAFALGISRIFFLIAALGSLITIRVVTGLALALGPFFIAFLLFSQTRSLFEGWIRVLAGAALASLMVFIVLGLELALIEPWLAQALAIRAADQPLPSMPSELLVIVTLFGLVLAASIFAAVRLAGAFRLGPIMQMVGPTGGLLDRIDRPLNGTMPAAPAEEQRARTRSAALADHLMRAQAAERVLASTRTSSSAATAQRMARFDAGSVAAAQAPTTAGRAPSSRRTYARNTASARRRDTRQ